MNIKKIKLFSILTGASCIALILIAVIFSFLFGVAQTDEQLKNSINTASWVLSILFVSILLISYISLIIQAARNDQDNWVQFLWLAILSILPPVALALACRCSHIQFSERQKKLSLMKESIKEMDEIKISESEEQNEFINNNYINISLSNNQNELVENIQINNENVLNEEETNNQYFDEENKIENNKEFDRNRYLTLKGTNYSKTKKDGKKKIPNSKWNELVSMVDKLEMGMISEKEFFKEKDRILSTK